jgi:hypothetical protein
METRRKPSAPAFGECIHPLWTHRWHRRSQPMHAGAHRAFRAWRTAENDLEKDAAGKAQVIKLNFKEGFNLIFNSINQLQDKKPKTGDRIAAISRLVPGAGQFSNPLFANLDEFRALKESLKREGIFDETWETLVIPRRGASCSLPYRP